MFYKKLIPVLIIIFLISPNRVFSEGKADIRALINSAVANKMTRLVIPPGEYRLAKETGGNSILSIENAIDLEITAEDVNLVCTSLTRAIVVDNCTDLTIKGLKINYDPLPFTQGVITNTAADLSYLDITLHDGYPKELYDRLTIYDPVTRFQKKGIGFLWDAVVSWQIPGSVIRVSGINIAQNAVAGDMATLSTGPVDGIPHGVSVSRSSGTVFENVSIYSAPGFGFIDDGSQGAVTLDGLKVICGDTPDGGTEKPLLSSSWDGIQVKTAKGGITIKNCEVENAGDDSVSIQSNDYMVVKKSGNRLIVASSDPYVYDTIKAGHRLRIFNGREEDVVRTASAVSLSNAGLSGDAIELIEKKGYSTGNLQSLNFRNEPSLNFGDIFFDFDCMGNGFLIKDNYIRSPGRGVLLKAGNGIIEGNTFWGCDKAVVACPELAGNSNAGCAFDVVIRNNIILETGFHHDMPWSEQAGAICFSGYNVLGTGNAFSNITIENNIFNTVRGLNIGVSCAGNVKISGNTVINSHSVENGTNGLQYGVEGDKVFYTANSKNVNFTDNHAVAGNYCQAVYKAENNCENIGIVELITGNKINVKFLYGSNNAENLLVLRLSDENRLIDFVSFEGFSGNIEKNFSLAPEFDYDSCRIDVLVWDGFGNLFPLYPKIKLLRKV